MTREFLKKVGLVLLIAVGLLVVMNFDYFWKNLKFYFVQPQTSESTGQIEVSKGEPDTLSIESLAINTPVIYVEDNTEAIFQEALARGVVHYPGTVRAGEYGNVYIFGHSSDNAWAKGDYKTVFALLPRIEIGAKIILTDWNGNPFVYIVKETFVAAANDVHLLDQGEYKKRLLTLQTSYPVGTSLKRFIVIAEIEEEKGPEGVVNPNPS